MLEPLYTAAEMREAEERYPGYPDSAGELMERAGAAVALEAMRAFPRARSFGVVCGGGANGGDGRIAARVLSEAGRVAEETDEPERYDVVIDALFGTGFRGAPREEAASMIERINACDAPVVAVDLPSGVNASTGEVEGAAVEAALTVTFHGRKVGVAVAPGRFHAGRVVVAEIGLEAAETRAHRATEAILRSVPRRAPHDSKYTAGTVLVVGGSPGMTGAAVLTATAALRADAGYVTLAVPRESLTVVEGLTLEPVKRGFAWETAADEILAEAQRARALALGPGLGRGQEARGLVAELLRRVELPTVVDADALHELQPVRRAAPTVLTPHAGELARLLDTDAGWVNEHRLEAAERCAEAYGAVVLLKGADTIVQAPGEGPIVCDQAPPSLATAGSGDVLTGVIAAFLAKGLGAAEAAAAAAVAHGIAAASVPEQPGLVASDVVTALPRALS
ncbi:MAG: NAD(P)H-hydrate dehydratase [Thermoleophilia bacterium]|nr:NAD(P)H-hydrate dehydratase [Thermoleophilia bacterium]MDH5332460.1 NAD(P)H-hydrate dehydratase [Thermoleophilia bacterium]